MALWVFFFLFRPVGLFTNIRLLARETIPGPERKKNEVAFRDGFWQSASSEPPLRDGQITVINKLFLGYRYKPPVTRQCCQCPTFCQIKCKYRKIGFFLHFVCMLHWNLFLICLHVSAERWLNPLLLNFEGYDVSVNLLPI